MGNQFFCSSGPAVGHDQGPRPQSVVLGSFVGNFSQQQQPTPSYTRLPPLPPFQANVTTPPPTQFSHSNPNPIQQQFPQSIQAAFPPQQNQFQFNTPPPNLNIAAAQQGN